ncbi:MAG TPA: hypothetical protein PK295_04420 [Candidatus Magasanikbacteria bacterium]|nr:hypothetical protein [Candidatus Magasanikbacteria bacterium]
MFETSRDLLYVVLSLAIIWFTVFLCWLMYQAGRTLRNVNRIVESALEKMEMISTAVEFIRKKVDGMSSHLGAVSGIASGLFEKFVVSKLSDKLDEKLSGRKAKSRKED